MFERCLYFNTNHLSRVVGKKWDAAYRELKLAPAHAYLLRLVLKNPGLTQKQIGEELHLEKSTITRFVDKMEQEGYLVRKLVPGRSSKQLAIYPTAKANEVEQDLNAIGDALYQQMQEALDPDELTLLVTLLAKASVSLSKA